MTDFYTEISSYDDMSYKQGHSHGYSKAKEELEQSHEAELKELVECLDEAISGEEWLLQSYPEATGKDDEVKLEKWKAVISKHH